MEWRSSTSFCGPKESYDSGYGPQDADFFQTIIVEVDASRYGLGAVLMQSEHTIA